MSEKDLIPDHIVEALLEREREALVARLLPGMVHNISGAVQMIRLPIDLIEMLLRQNDTATAVERLQAVHSGLERLGQELELVASKCRQEGDGKPSVLDLAHLVRTQLDYWRFDLFYKHEVKVHADLDFPGPQARCAWVDAALAFNCLIANALESMKGSEETTITIEFWENGDLVGLRVADSGQGPDPAIAETMFEPFETNKGEGHDGLGLFLARKAMDIHGGEISWRPGEKGGFVLSMPAA